MFTHSSKHPGLRSVGDYRGAAHVSHTEASIALIESQQFLDVIRSLLPPDIIHMAIKRETNPSAGRAGAISLREKVKARSSTTQISSCMCAQSCASVQLAKLSRKLTNFVKMRL
jgi:hypothetical protein